MYETRDLGSFLIMLAVAPLFIFVFAVALVVVLPLALVYEAAKWVNRHA